MNDRLTAREWHAWFCTQAAWTQPTRRWLYRETQLPQADRILDVGCGSGVISRELAQLSSGRVVGVDIDPAMVSFAHRQGLSVAFVLGDAGRLPFDDGSFDAVVCHYLLLWLSDPAAGVREMARVTRPGGRVLACAEPDYGGRIDHPPDLAPLGRLQARALRQQGAEPEIGRRLGELFAAVGLTVTVGTMAGQWQAPAKPGMDFEAEWRMRIHDLADVVPAEELARLRALDHQALEDGSRVLFVPTFYAIGEKTERN